MSTWAFEHLNELNSPLHDSPYFDSPTNWSSSPPTGLTDPLAASLEAWTSAAFNFDHADFGGPTGYDGLFPEKEDCEDRGKEERERYKGSGGKSERPGRADSPPTLQDLLNGGSAYDFGGDGATFNLSNNELPSYVDQVLQLDGGVVPFPSVESTPSAPPEAFSQKDATRPSTRAIKKRKTSNGDYNLKPNASESTSPAVSAESLDKRQRNTAASGASCSSHVGWL